MFLYYIFDVNYILMKNNNKEIKKNEAFSKKRGPLIIISGGGGGPLQVVPFIEDVVLIIKLKKYILLRKILMFI